MSLKSKVEKAREKYILAQRKAQTVYYWQTHAKSFKQQEQD